MQLVITKDPPVLELMPHPEPAKRKNRRVQFVHVKKFDQLFLR